ncbi:importin-9-like isoform X2 [Artemia franciscana]|uniref:importin-9-like isoform X2 n=1 Tax=Artemia franciscana TaxID=6661 RepID=UPI0032DAA958
MNTLVGIPNQYPEEEFLHLVLEVFPRFMALDQAFTAASAPNFLPFLRDVFAAETKDRTIIARIEEIIEKLVKIPEVLANIQTILFPALVQLLQVRSSTNGNLKAGLGNVFRMLKIIVRASTSPLGEELLQPLPLLLRVLDETIHTLGENGKTLNITTIKEGVELLRAYIVTSPSQFCSLKDSEGRSALHYALELASNLLNPQTCERALIDVGLLVNILVQTTGDQLAERKEILLRLVLNKLYMSKNFDVKQSLMMVFAHSVHTQFESVMDFLATFPGPSGTSALEFVLKEWVSMQKSFNGEFDIKISYIALAKILQYGINSSDQRLVAIQVNDDEILCEETSVRTQAQKKETHVEHTPITLLVKIFKLLLFFMQSKLEVDSWSDEASHDKESGHESEIGGDASENFESEVVDLSTLLKEEDCNDLASVCSYAEVLQHPLYSVNLCVYLKGFISQFVAQGVFESSFRSYLNKAEKKTLRLLGINV